MLDAFIIERIRQQREDRESSRQPLRVEIPLPSPPEDPAPNEPEPRSNPQRGVVIIDDTL